MFGPKCVSEIKEQVGQLLESYQGKIDEAYLRQPEDMGLSISVKLSPGDTATSIKIETGLSFVAERIKDKTKGSADEAQMTIDEAA